MKPTFFATPIVWRNWLEAHHRTAGELLVGFFKRKTGRASITWPESVDQALCFGWIDGIRRSLDEDSYTIRFTPRKKGSNWSAININRVGELTRLGMMHPAGLAAFQARKAERSGIYSYEQERPQGLAGAYAQALKEDREASAFFESQPPWYRRTASHWVMSAKREETRLRRLATLISDSRNGRTIGPLTRPAKSSPETQGKNGKKGKKGKKAG